MLKINKDYSHYVMFIVLGCYKLIKIFPAWLGADFCIVYETEEGAQGPFLLEHLPPWCWICDTHHVNHQCLQEMNDRNAEGMDLVKEVQQPMKSLNTRDC